MFQLKDSHRDITDEELIKDLKEVSKKLNADGVICSMRSYAIVGKYSCGPYKRRYGSWNEALKSAGIKLSTTQNSPSEKELLVNLRDVWLKLGKQPAWREMKNPISKYSPKPYTTKFGSWRKSLEYFVDYCKKYDFEFKDDNTQINQYRSNSKTKKRTNKDIPQKLKLKILMERGNNCSLCGNSPNNPQGTRIEFDHIIPYSKGGETVEDNLEVKCMTCNRSKGNRYNK